MSDTRGVVVHTHNTTADLRFAHPKGIDADKSRLDAERAESMRDAGDREATGRTTASALETEH